MNRKEMVFETERLWVRPWHEDDVEGWHGIIGNEDVMRYVDRGKTSPNLRETARQLAGVVKDCAAMPTGLGWWAAIEKATGKIIGSVSLSPSRVVE